MTSGHPYKAALTAACAVVALTVMVVVVAPLQFAYRSPLTHVAIESAAVVVAGLAAAFSIIRFRRTGAMTDLLLFATLLLLAVTNLGFSLIPALSQAGPGEFSTWGPAAARFLGAVGFVLAALAGNRLLRRPQRAAKVAVFGSLVVAAAIGLVVAALGDALPAALDVEADPEASGRPLLEGHPVILGIHLTSVVLYGVAAWGFARQSLRGGERLGTWLAVVMVMGAGARLNYFLFPSLYSDYVYVGDILRVAFYLTLLGATITEILGYERRLATVAVTEERRRIARDLHDGLAQELAFIAARAGRLDAHPGSPGHDIAQAAGRALRESRGAMSMLTGPVSEPFPDSLRRVAAEATRGETAVGVTGSLSRSVSAPVREAVLRIVAEAAGNAARHGQAARIDLHLRHESELRVRIADDGTGFDVESLPQPGHFGLISMRERAEALGGSLRVSSSPGRGTDVEVVFP